MPLDADRSTAIFRILQEALTNVARHAQATMVRASLVQQNGDVVLVVQDDGKGISESDVESSSRTSLGLLGMKERAEACGGELQIWGDPGTGTTLAATYPARRIETSGRQRRLILLADDHVVVRRGLRDMLANAFPGAQFVEASTGDEVLGYVRKQVFDLLILDVNMPGRSGVDVLKEVKNLNPDIPVLILSVQPEDQYAVRCLKAGASGYLSKDGAEEELVKAARKVIEGGRYISPQLSEKLARETRLPSAKKPHQLLSDRELEVMRMIAAGKSLTDIAEMLHVSVKTVSTYRSRCLLSLKMQMQSNADLVRYALEHKLLP